jgi:two-component system, OmpR family, KDP operon response regulator KdpE
VGVTDVMPLLLVIEDDAQIRNFLRASLASNGYRVIEATDGAEGLSKAEARNPDLVLLDLGLPDMDGLEVTRRLREWGTVPIVVLSARGREQDKIRALDAGADDYLTKPFWVGELRARIRVALRHAARAGHEPRERVLTAGALRLDLEQHKAFVADGEVHLTPTQFKLFATLMKHPDKVLTHRQLLEEVWGPKYGSNTEYLRVYMAQLRRKLETNAARPRYLTTEPGVGYRLKTNGPAAEAFLNSSGQRADGGRSEVTHPH